ncbi:MAG TPA: hypothetical protein VF116_03070 [Ktedonobacterales bacterium]
MYHSSLDRPYDRLVLPEPGYSWFVERHLIKGYRLLKVGGSHPNAYLRAHEQASACLGRDMSIRQRMRVFYLLGSVLIAGEALDRGIMYLEQAMMSAALVHDWLAWAELAYLAGSAEQARDRFNAASTYFAEGLDLLHEAFREDGPVAADLELDLSVGAAGSAYISDDHTDALLHLGIAHSLLDYVPSHQVRLGSINWIHALILRWQGHSAAALPYAVQADGAYEQATTPTARQSHGRLQTVTADIALDIVEELPEGSARDALLAFSEGLPARARTVARRYDDEIGAYLAALTRARWDRLADRNVATHDAIWDVVQGAKRIGNAALLAQAGTAWGLELVSRGWREVGLDQYRQTLADLRFTEVPAMGKWARGKLIEAGLQGW